MAHFARENHRLGRPGRAAFLAVVIVLLVPAVARAGRNRLGPLPSSTRISGDPRVLHLYSWDVSRKGELSVVVATAGSGRLAAAVHLVPRGGSASRPWSAGAMDVAGAGDYRLKLAAPDPVLRRAYVAHPRRFGMSVSLTYGSAAGGLRASFRVPGRALRGMRLDDRLAGQRARARQHPVDATPGPTSPRIASAP